MNPVEVVADALRASSRRRVAYAQDRETTLAQIAVTALIDAGYLAGEGQGEGSTPASTNTQPDVKVDA